MSVPALEKSVCSQTTGPKASPGAPPSSGQAAPTSKCAAAAHGSPPRSACAQPSAGAQPGLPAALQAPIPPVPLTSYLKMRQPPLQTRPQFRLND